MSDLVERLLAVIMEEGVRNLADGCGITKPEPSVPRTGDAP